MTRTPFALAALASAAVPGLDPVGVQTVLGGDDRFDTAIVADTDDRTWVIRAPRSEALAGQMDLASTYLALLARRVPFAVPLVRGWVDLKEGGRAAVSHLLPGERLDFAALPPGPGVTAELGRTIGTLHNVDPALAEEAGLSTYPADDYRRRRLAALDRAAATGHVPAALLTRWEAALEDTALWHYHPVPVHGSLRSENVLVTFTDPDDAATGTVKALTGWEDARVGDPADDFAALVADASTEAVHAALEAYAHTRVERPDRNLLVRATLAAEMS
ncbi:phosphotransferase, partial [Kribbia dieselivorans]|uniref:phosphotransferase n=1 Tax=Kribbia dieselivorans TaxID=331526 RepID=UPI0012ECCB81